MSQFGYIFRTMPPVTKNLIIVNLIVWLAMTLFPSLGNKLMTLGALHFIEAPDFNPAQLFVYMFMHSTQMFTHILFNMFTLFMFGTALENVFGSKRFLFYYISCGFGAALIQECVWALTLPDMVINGLAQLNHTSSEAIRQWITPDILKDNYNIFSTIGASGAVYGILLAFAMLFPNQPMYLMFIPVPIKAKWMIAGFVALELLIGLSAANDGVAHFAHLGGMLIGFIIIFYWKKKRY